MNTRRDSAQSGDDLEPKPRPGEYSLPYAKWVEITNLIDWQRRFLNAIASGEGRIELQNSRHGPRWVVVPVEKS